MNNEETLIRSNEDGETHGSSAYSESVLGVTAKYIYRRLEKTWCWSRFRVGTDDFGAGMTYENPPFVTVWVASVRKGMEAVEEALWEGAILADELEALILEDIQRAVRINRSTKPTTEF